ncbi:duf1716 domain containing protein [Grosmannia clavigera kw1407]|uniref:Duf1716 domain containing protein n=1 Tax=Grosmannia clavigera (strain kw1407 / UAMH 11150) TaxID=655863 RepID=F0XDX8_GROCL|nr:duf1716 domain containing protein [Grosmannia clavigera kw1407]EFX04650.1 duf1716 domain containing protein [Grosmannia clavigera kw1407]
MTSIDELFKKSGIPSKRKLEPLRDPNEIYKAVRLSGNGSHNRNGNERHVQIDENDQDEAGPARPPADGDDGDYGPAAPPEGDDEPGDDDEGRFFGSGMSRTEATIMDYVEGQDAGGGSGGKEVAEQPPPPETYDAAWLRRTVLSFERRINRNAELRARYEAEPAKFIASEAELDVEIKALSILGEHPELYPEFVRLGSVASLVGLLAHENTDIAISAIEIIGELTDEDVDATDEQWNALVADLLDADLIGLLVSNLDRLGEDADEADRTGVYYAMGIVENLSSTRGGLGEEDEDEDEEGEEGEVGEVEKDGETATKSKRTRAAAALGAHEGLVRWLLKRVQRVSSKAGVPAVTQNRQYAAEVLAILAQAEPENRQRLVAQDAVDTLLQLVAAYRRRDPEKGSDEEEYMENLFEALTCLVDDAGGKQKFVDAEGVELCLLLFAAGHKKSLTPALRLLDHAAGVGDGDGATAEAAADVCRRIIDAGGLKAIFTLFMRGEGHHSKKHGKNRKKALAEQTLHGGLTAEHLVNIFASMLRLLAAESAERIRLLAKFVEKDYAKVERLLSLRQEYSDRVTAAEQRFGDGNGDEAERLAQRLDAGLFTRQTIDVILAWLVAEDDGAQRKICVLLADRDETLATLRLSLQERRDGIDPDVADGRDTQEMLTTLMGFLEG